MSQQWFVFQGGKERGPFSLHKLLKMCGTGKLSLTDLVRTPRSHGRNNWRAAGEIKGLFGDPELLRDARRQVGDQPSHPDNQADWGDTVNELYEEMLSETIESDFDTSPYKESFANIDVRDAHTQGRHLSASAGNVSDTKTTSPSQSDVRRSTGEGERDLLTKSLDGILSGQVVDDFSEAFEGTSLSAETQIHSDWNLVRHHLLNPSESSEQSTGLSVLLKLAEQGYVPAQALLGQIYWSGEIVPKDSQIAANWFRKAADAGDGWSMQRLGLLLFDGDGSEINEVEAFHWFQKAANLGIDEAMNMLGICYLRGRGTAKNGEKAIHWLNAAVDLDCTVAQYNLGRRYFLGEVVDIDYEKAFWLFKQASRWTDKEAPSSEWYIYWCYKDGLGTEPDLKLAIEWLRKGANRECPLAMSELGRIYMCGEGVDRNFETGTQLLQRSALAGEAHAQFHLGIAYQNGDGVVRDDGEAIRWFYLASRSRSNETAGFVGGIDLAVSHLWDMIAPLIADRLRLSSN